MTCCCASSILALSILASCGLDVDEGANPTPQPSADAGDARAADVLLTTPTDAAFDTGIPNPIVDASDGKAPLTGWCATQPNAFLCDDFDHGGGLSRWDGVQTTNGNTVAISQAQSKTAPSSLLVNMFESPFDGGNGCDKATVYKIFNLDFEEVTLGFDIYPTVAGKSVAASLFVADGANFYQVQVAVGSEAFIEEGTAGPAMEVTASSFNGDLLPNAWTRVTIRYARTPAPGKISVLYDNVLKHEKAMRGTTFTANHRLYIGDFCAKAMRAIHIDNVAFEKVR